MKRYQKIITYGALIAGLTGLSGCEFKSNKEPKEKTISQPEHFADVPMDYRSGMAITSGDFDGDGDLDFIVCAKDHFNYEGNLYFFINDGKGNFTLKKPTIPAEKQH